MSPIEIQKFAADLAFEILQSVYHGENPHKVFPIYEMIVEDFNFRQQQLIAQEMENYFSQFADVRAIAGDDTQEFYVSSGGANENYS